ncbi:hypothetical protein [Thiobacillus denitrificans]|uniref:hypothetical protein n=1 Tax=Thiobacillus denitrificans TaxID=36861 RepID=UPI0003A14BEE|nr:hypothetical protein [Thiobacillus denitrificans]
MQSKRPFQDMTRETLRQHLTGIASNGPCESAIKELQAHTSTAKHLGHALRLNADPTPVAVPSNALPILI